MSLVALLAQQSSTPGGPPPLTRTPPETWSQDGAWFNFADPPSGAALPVHDRPLGWYFDNEDVVISWTDGADVTSWVLRDYEGSVVASGSGPTSPLNLGRPGLGWYKLYFTRATDQGLPWGTDAGETTFVVARSTSPLRTTAVPAIEERFTQAVGGVAAITREVAGHGMVRLDVYLNETTPASWRTSLDNAKAAAIEATSHVAAVAEEGAPREIYAMFVSGTGGATPSPTLVQQITDSVQELVPLGVTHFEGLNEPNTKGVGGAATAATYAALAPIVHNADPSARVVGPAPVTINPTGPWGLAWFEDFLDAGGGEHVDVISFHPYNAVNNDLNQARRVYEAFLDLLATHEVDDKPRWMTEWGTFVCVYGSFEPRWQVQTTMLDLHLMWQILGVHRNQTVYFYDLNNGYWVYPSSMWSNNRGRILPYALPAVWRAWVEETWEMELVEALDFGAVENRHWIGSRFRHPVTLDECLTIQGSGRFGPVTLSVSGASSLTVVDHFGRTSSVTVTAGKATVECGPEPVHVRVPASVSADVVPANYGANVTPTSGMTFRPSTAGNGPERAVDGLLQNSYEIGKTAGEGGVHDVWMATSGDYLPAWWTVNFSTPVTFDAVEIICPPPWQANGTLLDFDVQAQVGGVWQTVHTETHDASASSVVWASDKAISACWADSFWDRRRIFVARLDSEVTATALRIWARDVSWGGSATIDQARTLRVLDGAGKGTSIGQGGPKRMTIQEVALYLS